MNRLRVRVGEVIKERVIAPPDDNAMLWIEDRIDIILGVEFHFGPYRMEYLGEFAWDIFIDDRKVGHAKAWDEKPVDHDSSSPGLFNWLLLIGLCYLALC